MTVNEAVLALRKHVRKTQQVFATELKMSIASLQNYEQDRMPQPKQLWAFARAARAAGREDLSEIFMQAVREAFGGDKILNILSEIQLTPAAWYEKHALETVKSCLEGKPGYRDFAFLVMGAVTSAVEKLESDPETARRFVEESVRRGYKLPPQGKRPKK